MAFISKDWRDPGKLWIKTDRGWEEKMVIEKMEMLSDSDIRYEDLVSAMQNALVTATQREVIATQRLRENSEANMPPDVLDQDYCQLRKAREDRRFIEWELIKRKCFHLNRIAESLKEVNTACNIAEQRGSFCENSNTDATAGESVNKPMNETDDKNTQPDVGIISCDENKQERFLILKIRVKDRVKYIEKNKALLKELSPQKESDTGYCKADGNDIQEDESTGGTSCRKLDSNCRKELSQQQTGNHDRRTLVQNKELDVSAGSVVNMEQQSSYEVLRRHDAIILPVPPHCHITVKNTREISGFNRLCEVLKRLDFRGAVWDQQRFHYICKLIELLTTRRLRNLTGGSQKMLLVLLEEVALSVRSSQQNIHVLRRLVTALQERLSHCLVWGKQLGSPPLWRQNTTRLQLIQAIATAITIKPGDSLPPTLQDLPEECVRAILMRLAHHTDLQCAGEAYSVMGRLLEEQSLWRQLCSFHWSPQQISATLQQYPALRQQPLDWSKIYTRLRRLYGLKEEFAVSLVLCKVCHCLFWASLGHPCLLDGDPAHRDRLRTSGHRHDDLFVTIPPHTFLSFFS
uniref:F-box only protein 32 n=1 Tax=Hirondellea gigas TaxID=1518452 RepID=A0A6A7G2N2_9CRUS